MCKQKSNCYTNSWLIKALEVYEKEEKRKKELLKKCALCGFEGEKDTFWVHLIEEHKLEIIIIFPGLIHHTMSFVDIIFFKILSNDE